MSAVAQLRAVLDDLERVGGEWLGIEALVFPECRETRQWDLVFPLGCRAAGQRARRRRLEGLGRFARAVEVHPELGIDLDLGPERITALEAVDPEAAAAVRFRGPFTGGKQVVFVCGEKTVRLYVNGSYAYSLKLGSSLLIDFDCRNRRWEIEDWRLWPLEDVVDIAPRVLEEQPELAQAWRRITSGTTDPAAAGRLELGGAETEERDA